MLEERIAPDLVVGASVGALNGYLVASGISSSELHERWLTAHLARLGDLEMNIRLMLEHYQRRTPFAVVMTDLVRMKPKVVRDDEIGWKHIAASCAIPGMLAQQRINGRFYSDGGLLNPLPVWVAAELGATRIYALNALPEIPASPLRPLVKSFRFCFGHHPPTPDGVQVTVLQPSEKLGGIHDALYWKRNNIERWLELGARDAEKFATAELSP